MTKTGKNLVRDLTDFENMPAFCGVRSRDELTVWRGDRILSPRRSQKLRNHSPAGFEWGYGGSGPAQLALAILLEVTTEEVALNLYQAFKASTVSRFPKDSWRITEDSVLAWLAAHHQMKGSDG